MGALAETGMSRGEGIASLPDTRWIIPEHMKVFRDQFCKSGVSHAEMVSVASTSSPDGSKTSGDEFVKIMEEMRRYGNISNDWCDRGTVAGGLQAGAAGESGYFLDTTTAGQLTTDVFSLCDNITSAFESNRVMLASQVDRLLGEAETEARGRGVNVAELCDSVAYNGDYCGLSSACLLALREGANVSYGTAPLSLEYVCVGAVTALDTLDMGLCKEMRELIDSRFQVPFEDWLDYREMCRPVNELSGFERSLKKHIWWFLGGGGVLAALATRFRVLTPVVKLLGWAAKITGIETVGRWIFKRFIKPIIDRFRGPKDPPNDPPPTGGSPVVETQPAPEPEALPQPVPPEGTSAPAPSSRIGVPEVLGAGAAVYGVTRVYSGLRAFFTGTALVRGLSANPSTAAIGLVPDIQYLPEALHYAVDCEIFNSSSSDCIEWRRYRREQRRFDLML